jgi:hypothetical protein
VERGDDGPVRILTGRHKAAPGTTMATFGAIGGRGGRSSTCEPFMSDYILVRRADLESLSECAEKPQSRSEVVGCQVVALAHWTRSQAVRASHYGQDGHVVRLPRWRS